MKIHTLDPISFKKYGRILEGYDTSRLVKEMRHTQMPLDDVVYVPSVEELEALPVAESFAIGAYGGLPIQVGYCNGNNHRLDALEYHRSSEINVAVTDLILLVGSQQDIKSDYTYDTELVVGFLIPAGTVVELYATTLHYAPCSAEGRGFQCVVVLPEGTNKELLFCPGAAGEERLLTARNKWLIAHEEAGIAGAFCGLKGKNLTVG